MYTMYVHMWTGGGAHTYVETGSKHACTGFFAFPVSFFFLFFFPFTSDGGGGEWKLRRAEEVKSCEAVCN